MTSVRDASIEIGEVVTVSLRDIVEDSTYYKEHGVDGDTMLIVVTNPCSTSADAINKIYYVLFNPSTNRKLLAYRVCRVP